MKTAAEVETAFGAYFREFDACLHTSCYWALLHLLVALPDICAALDGEPEGGERYGRWCQENFPDNPAMTPGDRYQMRCALLHEGTTLPRPGSAKKKIDLSTRYKSFSFTDPHVSDGIPVHQMVSQDVTRAGPNLSVDIKELAHDTRAAMRSWFQKVEKDPARNAIVESNLPRLAAVKPKTFTFTPPTGGSVPISVVRNVTSSS